MDATRSKNHTIEYGIEIWAERRDNKLTNDIRHYMRQWDGHGREFAKTHMPTHKDTVAMHDTLL